jgi:hypothetical protein
LNAWFDYLQKSTLHHTILVGNHDWFNLECKDHALRTLSALPNVLIIDKPRCSTTMSFLPYCHNPEQLKFDIELLPANSVLFAHLDVKQFDYGNGQISESGLDLQDLYKFKKVISGHYHKFQERGNLTYLGTPFSHSFGESDQEKYIGIFDDQTGILERIKSPIPQHVTLELDLDDTPDIGLILEWVQQNQKNFKRILLWGPQAKIVSFPYHEFMQYNIRWIPKPDDIGQNNISLEEGLDNKTQFVKWATEIRKLDQETLSLGLGILEAVGAK